LTEIFNITNDLKLGLLDLKAYSIQGALSTKRDIETRGRNFLLAELIDPDCSIFYDEKGKPHLVNDSRHISISHSHDRLAIIVNNNEPTGIDIELIRNKVLRIKHKFLSQEELVDAQDDIEKLLIYWAAKETLYKIYGLKEVDFIEHLFVKAFNKQQQGVISGMINLANFREAYQLHYQVLPEYVLVYAHTKLQLC
jgi:phosphopantetheinyl transferase